MGNPLLEDDGPLVDWDTIGQERFDRLIAALVPFQHPAGSTVEIPDGRGGDGGIDALVTEPDQRNVIYQFKYFPEGFDGKHKSRRRQVTNPAQIRRDWGSLEHALEHAPAEWILVVPCNPTQAGWAWIRDLQNKYVDRVKITFIGRARLDGQQWCGGHGDVVRALHTRPELLTKAAILNQERAILAGSGDLGDRIQALGHVVDDLDPAWTLDFMRVGDKTVQTLRAKHPHADQTNPITLNFNVRGAANDPNIAAFRRAIDYGSFTSVALPGEFVTDFHATGSPLVEADEVERVIQELEIRPGVLTPENRYVALVLRDENEVQVSTNTGSVRRVSSGIRGLTLEQVLHGSLTLTWQLPTDLADPATVDVTFDSRGAVDAGELLKSMRLTRSLSRAYTVELQVGGKALMRGRFTEESQEAVAREVDDSKALLETVEDLAYVQQETNTFFPVPETIEPLDRIWLRVIRTALRGRMCFEPQRRTSFNMTLIPAAAEDEHMKPFLSGEPLAFVVRDEAPRLRFGDHEMVLPGDLAFVMRSGSVEDAATVRAGLERGEKTPAVVSSNKDEHLLVYMPSRIAQTTTVEPDPWGLTGLDEVAELAEHPQNDSGL